MASELGAFSLGIFVAGFIVILDTNETHFFLKLVGVFSIATIIVYCLITWWIACLFLDEKVVPLQLKYWNGRSRKFKILLNIGLMSFCFFVVFYL